jgi:hypothetical protein
MRLPATSMTIRSAASAGLIRLAASSSMSVEEDP